MVRGYYDLTYYFNSKKFQTHCPFSVHAGSFISSNFHIETGVVFFKDIKGPTLLTWSSVC